MKNLKKISLISFLACATLAGGILTANTEVETPVVDKYFRMEVGAQVRVPDVVEEGAEDFDGLRFTAVMSDAYRKDVGELDALSVGMFIMPAEYASKPINYANCFGESACYYWDGVEAKTEDAKEILHVESYAYEATPGDDYLTMKASVWNMNAENLDKEFVAVAYVTDGTNYYFAETAQGAKAVSVAQKALLNPEDEIHAEEGDAALVESAYVNAYRGEGKEVSYKVNAYKEQKDGTYELTEETITETVTSYNQLTSVKAPAKYNEWTANENNGADTTILFDGTTEVTKYYNYAGDRVVLVDGDTFNSPECGFKGTNNYEQDGTFQHKVSNFSISEGKSIEILTAQDAWAGPWWAQGVTLGFTTNTITMDVYCAQDIPELHVEFYVPRYTVQAEVGVSSNRKYLTYKHPEVLEGGKTHQVTMTFSEYFSTVVGVTFYTRQVNAGAVSLFVDNICAVGDSFVHDALPYTYTDSISFANSDFNSNVLWDGEEFAVSYKKAGAEDYTDLTAVDGVYTIAPEVGSNYELKFTAGEKSFTHTVVPEATMIHFDETGDDRWYSIVGSDYTAPYGADVYGDAVIGRPHAGDSFYLHYYNLVIMVKDSINFDPVMTSKIGLWIFAENDVAIAANNRPWFRVNGYAQTTETTYKAGYHYYEFTIPELKTGERAMQFDAMSNIRLYVDAVAFIK